MATQTLAMDRGPTVGPRVWCGRVLFGITSTALLLVSLYWHALGEPWGPGTSAVLAYSLFAIHFALLADRLSPMDPLVWLPVGLLLFYFGLPVVIEWLGVTTIGGYDPWQVNSALILDRGFCVALLAVAAFLWGIHLSGVVDASRPPKRQTPVDRSLGTPAVLFMLGALTMLAVGVALVGPSALFGLYSDWWDSKRLGADQRFVDTGLVFSAAGVYALLASDEPKVRWRRWFAYLVLAGVLVIAIQKGDRTMLVTAGVGAGWCYSQRIKKLRWTPVLIGAFVAILAFPVIREWRAERRLDASKRATVRELVGESIYGLGSSVMAIVYIVDLMPRDRPYAWGATLWNAGVNAIPNISFSKGVSWKQTEIENMPANWIVWQISPAWAATGGGYGFAMAAEWYFNFGMPGVLVGMAFSGFGVARVRNASSRSSLALVWSATLYAAISIWIRNTLGYPLKVAIWPVGALWLIRRFVLLMRGRAERRALPAAGTDPLAP